MMNFTPLNLDGLDIIRPYMDNPNKRAISLNSLAYAYTSHKMLQTKYAIIDDVAILCYQERNNTSDFVCSLHNWQENNITKIISSLIEYAHSINKELIIAGFTKEDVKTFQRLFPNRCREIILPATWDYIYNRSDLEFLKGSKYQPKRNHINKFKSLYEYRFEPLNLNIIDKYIQFCCNTHQYQEIGDEFYISLEDEILAMKIALENYNRLNLFGGALYVNDELVAFTFGAKLTDNMFDIMVEKANTEYNGVYSMISNLFVKSLPQEYIYINREEDLGVEGLRKAKLSYSPCVIQENYRLYITT